MSVARYVFFITLLVCCLHINQRPCFSNETAQNLAAAEIWELLLQSRQGELQGIDEELESLNKRFPAISQEFTDKFNIIEQSYQQYIAMAKVSRGMPIELSLVDERLKKLNSDLATVASPVNEMLSLFRERLQEVSLLEQAAPTKAKDPSSEEKMRKFTALIDKTSSRLNSLEKKFSQILRPAEVLQTNIDLQKAELAAILPGLWKNYYFVPTVRLYAPQAWSMAMLQQGFYSLKESFFVRVEAEVPEDKEAWATVFLQWIVLIVPLSIMLLVARSVTKKFPEEVRERWGEITAYSLPLLFFGLTNHFAAWNPSGENYYLISIVGTVFMCLGQIDLAWNLYVFNRPKRQKSPFLKLLIPLFGGIVLLTIGVVGAFLSLLWILLLILSLYLERKYSKVDLDHPLVKNIFRVYRLVLWLNIGATIFGWVRLSILSCVVYAALAVCIQQAFGVIRFTNVVSQNISQEGFQGLISGMLLALFLPAALIVGTSITGLWVLAYPGGAYLISHLTRLDFSIGEVTVNVAQVLLVVSVFYVTRSFISVGRMFIASLAEKNIHIEKNLAGPVQLVFTYVVWSIFIIYTLYLLGLSLTSLTVVAGGLSVGLGFGLQTIMNNFVSGLLIIFGQTLREGDIIEVGTNSLMCVVRKINMRATLVETFDNATIFVPNSELITGKLTNWTRNGRSVRKDIAIGVAYGSDVDLVMSLLKSIANDHPRVLHFPEPYVLFNNFGSSSLEFLLRFWVGDISQGLEVTSELRVTISKTFDEKMISISFPQLDVRVCRDSALIVEGKQAAEEVVPNASLEPGSA